METFVDIARNNQRPQTVAQEKDFAFSRQTHPEMGYARQHLLHLDQGSARNVFALDGDKVLKIAKNQEGIYQNKNEIDVFLASKSPVITTIYDYDKEHYKWIVAERLKMMTDEEFLRLTGIPLRVFGIAIDAYTAGDGAYSIEQAIVHKDFPEDYLQQLQALLGNKQALMFLEKVSKLVNMFELDTGDIVPKHFGLSKTGQIKLYDYGAI